ncbi:MAG: peptide-methionine (R)-S-oxide reductase MsrB [Rhodoferax sp.]|nr:peptide-methionine (R)-S-oxide reductase MsrB [Rhodoferax sp.]
MNRRFAVTLMGLFGLGQHVSAQGPGAAGGIVPLKLSDAEWQKRLTPAQYQVLRQEGTERAGTSPLNNEKRKGTYHCAGCDLALFTSATKYDSGTGWPSFFDFIPGTVQTKTDFKMVFPRKEYHCARCGGHHGHVFDDGPKPTGLRYCNNGVALKFVVAA